MSLFTWVRRLFSDLGHRQKLELEPQGRFEQVHSLMPILIAQMARDLKDKPNVRWCVPLESKWTPSSASREHFRYYASEHPDLLSKFDILEKNGYVRDVTPGNRWEVGKHPIYAMTDDFVERLRAADR